jgi:hypothetical protein
MNQAGSLEGSAAPKCHAAKYARATEGTQNGRIALAGAGDGAGGPIRKFEHLRRRARFRMSKVDPLAPPQDDKKRALSRPSFFR